MAKYPFPLRGEGDRKVIYATGQGMGMYSSWTAMAVTHHLLVLLAAHRCGRYAFKDYAILGDDIVVADECVALAYKDLMLRIGLNIRLTKTISPHGDKVPVEFASKLIFNGVNISPLPMGLLLNGGVQGTLQFLHFAYEQAVLLGESESFWNGLRVYGSAPTPKGVRANSSLCPEATDLCGLPKLADPLLIVWGFSL